MEHTFNFSQSIIEVVLHPVIIIDTKRNIINISKATLKGLRGYTTNQVIGTSLYSYISNADFPYQKLCGRINDMLDYVIRIDKSVSFRQPVKDTVLRVTLTKYAGQYIIVQIENANKEWKTGKKTTDILEIDKLNKLILDNANSGFVYIDSDHKIIWENISSTFTDPILTNHFQVGQKCYYQLGKKDLCIGCPICRTNQGSRIGHQICTTPDGLSVEIFANQVLDDRNSIKGFVLRINDVTERENVRKELEESKKENVKINKLLLAILESMPEAFFIKNVDADYRYILANKQFCTAIGYPGSIVGKNDFDLFPMKDAQRYRKQDVQVAEEGITQDVENEIRIYADKKKIWHTTKFPLIDKDFQRKLVIGISHDITERVKAQHEIESSKTLLEFTFTIGNIITWEYDLATDQIHSTNKDSTVTDHKMYLEAYIESIVHPDHKGILRCEVKKVLNGETKKLNIKILALRFGKYEWLHAVGQRIKMPQTGQVKVIGLSRIITREVVHQQELALAKQKAERSDALKTAFLANMSHEIRTPLNSIVGFSQLLCATNNKKEQQKYIEIINHNSDLLLNLINDILDLSKIEAGYTDYNNSFFNLNDCFSQLEATIKPKIKPGINLLHITPKQEVYVNLDKHRVTQILTILLTNASKFTEKGEIEMGYELKDGGIQLYVRDTGCGVEEGFRNKIFDRFEKIDEFTQGTGLGLTICKAIVQAYHGKIGVISRKGEGSTFWVWIPSEILYANNDNIQDLIKLADKQAFQGIRILIAEDTESNYLFIKSILKGADLVYVTNGKDAVDKVREEDFDIILMDIIMPVMNGLQAIKEIRSFNTTTPILAEVANTLPSDQQMALEYGANDFVEKPINIGTLLEQISHWSHCNN